MDSSSKITCPHCGKSLEISEALAHSFAKKNQEEIDAAKKAAVEAIEKKIREEAEFKLKDAKNENEELKENNRKLTVQLLELNKTIRALGERLEKQELENEKKLNVELTSAKEKIRKEEEERAYQENLILKKKLEDMQTALEEAKRKGVQGSQQLQGEVLELDIEEKLRREFGDDEIEPIKKGAEGGDIMQIVKSKNGREVGRILWESKKTKAWSDKWLGKLREDQRTASANSAVIISDVLPKGIETFDLVERVWVSSVKCLIPLAVIIRMGMLAVAQAKVAAENKDEKLEFLFKYLISETFKHRIEAQVEGFIELNADLETEKRATVKSWKKREIQHKKMINNISAFYGELQGIMGNALPIIKTLELPDSLEE